MKHLVQTRQYPKLDWKVDVIEDCKTKSFIVKVHQRRDVKTMILTGDKETKDLILFSIDMLEQSYKESL